jgi:hypothetical protein
MSIFHPPKHCPLLKFELVLVLDEFLQSFARDFQQIAVILDQRVLHWSVGLECTVRITLLNIDTKKRASAWRRHNLGGILD